MTRGELRQIVRFKLGESRPGSWSDEEINFYIQESCDRHAREGLSVEGLLVATSLPGVAEYEMADDYGEILSVRYQNEGEDGPKKIGRAIRDNALDWQAYGGTQEKWVDRYYLYDRSVGFYPLPSKPALFSHIFTGTCQKFVDVVNRETELPFSNTFRFELALVDADDVEELYPCNVYVSHIGLYLRRDALPYPGNLHLDVRKTEGVDIFTHESFPIRANAIAQRPDWYNFDFSQNPIEIVDEVIGYTLTIRGDDRYSEVSPSVRDGKGIQVGVAEQEDGTDVMYFQAHRLKNDIEVDYFRQSCNPIEHDDDPLEVPHVYYPHLENMTLEQCWSKRRIDMVTADRYGTKAAGQILEARTHAKQKTQDPVPMHENRYRRHNSDYSTYNSNSGLWHARLQ